MSMFNEEVLERITLDILYELGYECINGYEMERADYSRVILENDLKNAIHKTVSYKHLTLPTTPEV